MYGMIKLHKLIVLFAIIACSPSSASAEPQINEDFNYYTVNGSTAKRIRQNLNLKTPITENGKKYDAYTKWHVTWNLRWKKSIDSCEITEITTKVDITYILPKLEKLESKNPSLKRKWGDYSTALIHHENGHRDFGIHTARSIEERVLTMGPRSSCRQLQSDANEIGYRTLDEYIQLEKDYDNKTNYGMSDGAVFP